MTAGAPLAGTRILDLSRLLPGGYCTLLLADLGADVVKVEEPGRGDYIRWTPPIVDGRSAAHAALNRGKRSVVLNLKHPEGVRLLISLVERADVLVEGFRPGVMDRFAGGYDALSARNQRLVYCAISGYGQDGPYRDRVGHDLNYMGYGGALSLTPGEPAVPGLQVGDLGGGGMLAAVAILSALLERERTGRGRFLDVSMLDGIVSWLSIHAGIRLNAPDASPEVAAALQGVLACYRVYRTADGRHVTVAALEPPFWTALCETVGCPELVTDHLAPAPRQEEMAARLQEVFATRTRDEWMEVFADVPACVGPVNDVAEAFADPQVVHRRMAATVDGATVGPASPLPPRPPTSPPPDLGEHTGDVLAEVGVDAAELGRLRAAGVV